MPSDLKKIPLFAGLEEDDLRGLADKAVIRTFPKNMIIISEGDLTDSLYVILSGKVKVYLGDESGKELLLDVKGPGEYFGEMMLDEGSRSASVMTVETSQLAWIARHDFKNFLREHPDIALHVIRNLIRMVRGLNENVKSLAMLDVYGRVSRLLLDLAIEQDGALVIPEKLTQKDMASRVGASREMINRILRDLTTGGYIKLEGGKITIKKTPPNRW
jgi:CRP/FNR family cyclic AMP-dependent transcriptional regulator